MLTLIDRLAGWWLDMRMRSGTGKLNPELTEITFTKAVIEEDGLSVEGISPMIAVFAEEAAKMLDKRNAKNYLEINMFPRVDRQLRGIRLTVAWMAGKSPAQRVIDMEKRVIELEAQLNGAAKESDQ